MQLLKQRRQLVGEDNRKRTFESGWHLLPIAEPIETNDKRLWVLRRGDLNGVLVMGRSEFAEVRARVEKLLVGKLAGGLKKLLIYGPKGTGKTHLLVQLVLHLTEEFNHNGDFKRIAPILDSQGLVVESERVTVFQDALAWAYWNAAPVLLEIAKLESMADVKHFLKGRKKELVWAVDQYQALENEPAAKSELDGLLRKFPKVIATSGGSRELTEVLLTGHPREVTLLVPGLTVVSSSHNPCCWLALAHHAQIPCSAGAE